MTITAVLSGERRWHLEVADCLAFLASLPPDSVDLICGSPPYAQARWYLEKGENLGIARPTEEWVRWMVEVYRACLRVCTGLVAFVVDDQTRNYAYGGGPLLLAADLLRAGVVLRKPPIYRRIGIPGSGGPDWLRSDYELILCATRGGRLPWSDNTAMGHLPKWGPGGETSHRLTDGARVNQWGGRATSGTSRQKEGTRQTPGRPAHRYPEPVTEPGLFGPVEVPAPPEMVKRGGAHGYRDGDVQNEGIYHPPVLANPGNVAQRLYTAQEVVEILGEVTDVVDCTVGGGQMGSKLCHENEAPYPERLAEFFVRSFARPGSVVLDPFAGSGTTGAAAIRWGRRFLGCDLRASQVELSRRRLEVETPDLFVRLEDNDVEQQHNGSADLSL
jgi:hypothetical protein